MGFYLIENKLVLNQQMDNLLNKIIEVSKLKYKKSF